MAIVIDGEDRQLSLLIFEQVTVMMFGIFLWYLTLSFPRGEGRLLFRRARLGLVHVPYFGGRYSQILALALLTYLTHWKKQVVECEDAALLRTISISGNIALASASANLAVRAFVIWKDKALVTYCAAVLCFTHFVYGIGVGVTGVYKRHDPISGACTLCANETRVGLFGYYVYTFLWDGIILVSTFWGLRRERVGPRSRIGKLILTQAVLYASLSLLLCVPIVGFAAMPINLDRDVYFAIPVCTISVIASSLSVASLFGPADVRAPRQAADIEAGPATRRSESMRETSRGPGLLTSFIDEPSSASGSGSSSDTRSKVECSSNPAP